MSAAQLESFFVGFAAGCIASCFIIAVFILGTGGF